MGMGETTKSAIMSGESPEPPLFPIMDSGIPQWAHASLARQYADILDEPVPPELLALLADEDPSPAEAPATDGDDTPEIQPVRDDTPVSAMA
jgi:hypothetical protein